MRKWLFVIFFLVPVGAQAGDFPPTGAVLSAPGGRYVFGQISPFHEDQYLLDTQTGRLWILALGKIDNSKIEINSLHEIPYQYWDWKDGDPKVKFSAFPEMDKWSSPAPEEAQPRPKKK